MNILTKILETKNREVTACKATAGFEQIYAEASAVTRPVMSFSKALRNSETGIIAEFKRRSPSKGYIHRGADAAGIVSGYSAAGAAAVSVLTDAEYFGGGLDDLVAARRVTDLPLLRKDFIIDEYQICEARIAGADVVLLIAAAMSPERCASLAGFARSLGLEVLLEIHSDAELEYITDNVNVVGVNNRDLTSFVTDTAVSENLARQIPSGMVKISESGISSPETVKKLRNMGFDGFLMGENFMKEPDPASALVSFIKELSE